MISLCTCWGTIFQYDVSILVTQIMSFVCIQTVIIVVGIKKQVESKDCINA